MNDEEKSDINSKIANTFIYKYFNESNVHGFSLIAAPQRHLLERILWLMVMGFSFYFSYVVCMDQYDRFENSPTVLSMETDYRNWEFEYPAQTICANVSDVDMAEELVKSYWNATPGDDGYEYYLGFLLQISYTAYNNLSEFRIYQGDPTLEGIDLLTVAREIRKPPFLPDHSTVVITELGICYSSSTLYYYQNALGRGKPAVPPIKQVDTSICRSTEVCQRPRQPKGYGGLNMTVYLHNKDEIMSPLTPVTQFLLSGKNTISRAELQINAVVASSKLSMLPRHKRKCSYNNEVTKNMKYYKLYTVNLCKMACRIEAAIKQCGCIPFFYVVESKTPVCSIDGMVCLSEKNWYDVDCTCYELCDNIEYRMTSIQFYVYRFEAMINILYEFPKTRIKRNVVFTIDSLIVSIGGAAALFLGCSILSLAEFAYLLLEHFVDMIFHMKL